MKTKTLIKCCLAALATAFPLMCGDLAAQGADPASAQTPAGQGKKPNILRREVFRRHYAKGGSHDYDGTRVYVTDLVHAGKLDSI